MSEAAIIAARLWPALRLVLIRIGGWILRRVRTRGAQVVSDYMRARTDVFRDRRARALKRGQTRRAEWLTGRIRRWLRAASWLWRNRLSVNARIASALRRLALAERIPEVAPWESYAGWARQRGR